MTTRHCGYIVHLTHDIREDDAEHVINAIAMIRGVALVETVEANPGADYLVEARVKRSVQAAVADAVHAVLYPPSKP